MFVIWRSWNLGYAYEPQHNPAYPDFPIPPCFTIAPYLQNVSTFLQQTYSREFQWAHGNSKQKTNRQTQIYSHNGRKRQGHSKHMFDQLWIFIKCCYLTPWRLFTRGTTLTFFLIREHQMLQWTTRALHYELRVYVPPPFIR